MMANVYLIRNNFTKEYFIIKTDHTIFSEYKTIRFKADLLKILISGEEIKAVLLMNNVDAPSFYGSLVKKLQTIHWYYYLRYIIREKLLYEKYLSNFLKR